ncbi:thrombomodulin [Pipistrellus kuhlii]|uniref:Thrombomodulin n=1 Tax=Pipistrellus kuhlii TaxID=59472 RepID=A0A7J7YB21_PIPKU|nr:thrombomodulin [Pipistrellus kuhlii]KAF6359191.1 thrombomodulin [Pipistrellus kuhlii]
MLRVLLLGVLGSAARGLPQPQPQPHGSQCIGQDCFALFRGPATFPAASQVCERLRGHLMTVRSSVAADVISLLLSGGGGESPRLWIGLTLPPGCSDPGHLGPLRGFQWVTGDNSTSYSRWARLPEAPASRCGPLCVAVSEAGVPVPGEPSWEERPCDTEADGFLCEFHFAASCKPLAMGSGAPAAASVSVHYDTPFGARGADFQALPLGSSAEVAPLGVELVCEQRPGEIEGRWSRAGPGAWDCGVENGGCEHLCNRSAAGGEPRCLCPADTAPEADGRSCTAACETLCQHLCHRNPDVPGGYSCMCDVGYQLAADQHKCEDVDDCLQVPSPCPQVCVNTQGSFECHCHPGYDLVDGECVKDLCLGNPCEYQCQPLRETDSPQYRCICAEGFAPVPNAPHKCQMFCNQTECPADCDPNIPERCQCPDGYILDEGSVCTDIDECASGYCNNAHSCNNLPGTFECVCGPGMVKTGSDCDLTPVGGGRGEGEGEGGDGGSGEPPVSPTPRTTLSPRPAGSVHSGVLIGISISSLCLVVALLALLCHLRKKQGSMQAELEYKCGVPSKEVVLQHMATEQMPQKL